MSQPVKLSDALVNDARAAAVVDQRSIAGQIELWARLGQVVDDALGGSSRRELLLNGGSKPLGELLAIVGTPEGEKRLKAYLDSQPFPHFEAHPARKGVLIRIDADGTRTAGRFIDRRFVEEAHTKSSTRKSR